MKNRGQITVLCSCMISILLILTLTALEVGRIYCSRLKLRAVIHSAQSCILADYNRELFERYHLLFMDPTYGTGSRAVMEQKFEDYLTVSLGESDTAGSIYDFSVEETALVDCKTILDDHMKLLKKQIVEYEKEEGTVRKIMDTGKNMVDNSKEVKEASEDTARNATELPSTDDDTVDENTDDNVEGENDTEKVDDPRDTLKQMLSMGVLALLLPEGTVVSDTPGDFTDAPSKKYMAETDKERDSDFKDVSKLVDVLSDSADENKDIIQKLGEKAAFCAYVTDHFSYQGLYRDSVMSCETEYIIKGKNSDHDNLEAVLSDIIWMRMPINYVCLLQDAAKQSEALTLATAICTSTGTLPMVEIVKYLLLGCWSYGESIYEVKQLMKGEKLPYIKTPDLWNTDLKSLSKTGESKSISVGMSYPDYLNVMLAKKEGKDIVYARMLDMIQMNLRQNDNNLSVVDLCGELTIQGKIGLAPLFAVKSDSEVYDYYYHETFSY